ncbi:hypothetical protein J2X73_003227 [Novosphingobium sp. 1748]|uniref:hypothetical protein n=1 Tax=Novosphingobium sp. 1748 TaxID=2817760 RepID=UPI002855322E|nr:hypothetical protein [Novosphingobium sp. 1748]MDR6708840.1 hypothetical protein [Novosphingobium sp. 1748]
MKNNPRLTYTEEAHDPNENIVDAEFEEIEDSSPADQPQKMLEGSISTEQWFRQQNWLIEILVLLGIAALALFLFGFILGSSPSKPPAAQQELPPSTPVPESTSTEAVQSEESIVMPNGLVAEGNCHMGECAWANIEKASSTDQTNGTKLVLLNILGGISPDTGSKAQDRRQIVWNDAPHQVYAYCSLDLPAVMTKVDGKWQVDIFDFTQGIPDILFDSVDLYSFACHGKLSAWSRPDFAQRYGYKAPAYNEVTIEKPDDITSL